MDMEQAIIPYRGQAAVLLGLHLPPDRYALRLGWMDHEAPHEWRGYEGIDPHAFRGWVIHVPKRITWSADVSDLTPMVGSFDDERVTLSQAETIQASRTWGPARWTLPYVLITPLPDGRTVLSALLEMHGKTIGVTDARAYFDAVVMSARKRIDALLEEQAKRLKTEERLARVRRRGETGGGVYHRLLDETGRLVFGLHEVEESADVRVIRVTLLRVEPGFYINPPCPSSSPAVETSSMEVNIRVECHEEKTLFDLLYEVADGQRLLDQLEAKLDHWMKRKSDLARLVDIHFARLRARETPV